MITAIVSLAVTGSFLVFAFMVLKTRYHLPDEDALKREEIDRVNKACDDLKARREANHLSEWEDFEPHYN